jgi:hypothetical protein
MYKYTKHIYFLYKMWLPWKQHRTVCCKISEFIMLYRFWVYLMKVIPETRHVHWIWYLRFYYYHLVDTSAGGLLVPEGFIRSVVSAPALTWYIRYYWNWQFLNNVIINKTKVLLLQAKVTIADFGYPVYALWICCFKNLIIFGLMKVIPETRRAHWIWYLRFDNARSITPV